MSKEQQAVPYTQGQWEWVKDSWHGGYSGIFTTDGVPVLYPQRENDGDTGAAWFDTGGDAGDETLEEGDARLILAARNSYARLGPDAVRLAEADLLGQAVEALRPFAKMADQYDAGGGNRTYTDEYTIIGINYTGEMFDLKVKHLRAARTILAQLPEQP